MMLNLNHSLARSWLLEYLEKHFYEFDNKYISFSLSGRNRAAIVIDKLLISSSHEKVENNLKKYIGDIESIVMLSLIKYWNKYGKMPSITSYVLETIVLDYFDTADHYTIKDGKTIDYPDVHFRDALKYIRDHIFSSVNDSKGIQGNINDLTYDQKNKIYNRANADYIKACNAVKAEVVESDNKKSINIWRDIFGDEFPKYE